MTVEPDRPSSNSRAYLWVAGYLTTSSQSFFICKNGNNTPGLFGLKEMICVKAPDTVGHFLFFFFFLLERGSMSCSSLVSTVLWQGQCQDRNRLME